MYEEILEKNIHHIKTQKSYRKYDREVQETVALLNQKKIIQITGMRYSGKTQLISKLLEQTNNLEKSFYFNSELDTYRHIISREELTILFDLFVRIHGVPKIVILQNSSYITGIKSFIGDLYKTKKYKILSIGNTLKLEGIYEKEVFPAGMSISNRTKNMFGGISQVRVIPDDEYKMNILQSFQSQILLKDIISPYGIKNIVALGAILTYIAESNTIISLREIHRDLKHYGIQISLLTLIEYINAILNSKLISKIHVFDVKNKKLKDTKSQYYFGDVGIRKSFFPHASVNENLIYIELKRNNFNLTLGQSGRYTFLFRASKGKNILSLDYSENQDSREIRKQARKLDKIGDTSEKYLLVPNKNSLNMRKFQEGSVKIMSIYDFVEVLDTF